MDEAQLRELYLERKMSMMDIAHFLGCSVHKITYWLQNYDIPRRTRSEAIYVKNNGLTDPFQIASLDTEFKQKLYGMGVGIFWGEGNKKCTTAVRMGNTDIELVMTFVSFLNIVCGVKNEKIRYGLQLFSDVDEKVALKHWQDGLNIKRNQIMPTVNRIKSGKIGTYRTKNQHGVMTVYVFNKKLRDWLIAQLCMPR